MTAGHAITKMTMEPSHPHFRYRSAGIPEGPTGRSFLSPITRTRYETFTDLGRTEIHVVPVVVRCLLLAQSCRGRLSAALRLLLFNNNSSRRFIQNPFGHSR